MKGKREEFGKLVRQLGVREPGVVFVEVCDGVVYKLTCEVSPGSSGLSSREREIAALVARGLSNKEIAGELGVSGNTVATYLRRIFLKFGVRSRAAMVAAWR